MVSSVKTLVTHERALLDGARPLPTNRRILGYLRRRGVGLELEEGESKDTFQARMETALMALFRDRRGEEEFQALYEYARPTVISAALRGGSGRLDPAEVCQDTFVNIYRYAAGFRDEHPRSFKAWVRAIARNVIRRQLSNHSRPPLLPLPDGRAEPVDRRPGPRAIASIEEERGALTQAWSLLLLHYAAAWEELSPRDREALQLVEVEGLSYQEGCERLGVGMSNMKMIMFRARRRIRARIAAAMGMVRPEEEERRVG
jgi:RNA polymerase sigma-70 factor, ECF subfamily